MFSQKRIWDRICLLLARAFLMSFFEKKHLIFKKKRAKRTASTIKHAKDYLYCYLQDIQRIVALRPQEVIEAWNEIGKNHYNGMTRAVGFKDHILSIKADNASLYALLKQTDQRELLSLLHQTLPQAKVKEIRILLG